MRINIPVSDEELLPIRAAAAVVPGVGKCAFYRAALFIGAQAIAKNPTQYLETLALPEPAPKRRAKKSGKQLEQIDLVTLSETKDHGTKKATSKATSNANATKPRAARRVRQ